MTAFARILRALRDLRGESPGSHKSIEQPRRKPELAAKHVPSKPIPPHSCFPAFLINRSASFFSDFQKKLQANPHSLHLSQ
jgi:hypothetical protein